MYTKIQVVLDAEPEKLGGLWALALGYVTESLPEAARQPARAYPW
jgi:hypothetical protein